MTAVSTSRLGHAFGALDVLAGIDMEVEPGEVLGIVGPSGCGKSTLLEIVAGLIEPSAGSISAPPSTYMPQRDLLLPWASAIDNAALGLRIKGDSKAAARDQVAPLFERFGLAGFESTLPGQLSGGMRQRVAFLRTLAPGKPVLLLDEPFASLDAITRGEMQRWLASAFLEDPRTALLVTHDVEEALYLCDRVLILSSRPGQIVGELAGPAPRNPNRSAAVSTPAFAEARGEALRILEGNAR